MSACTRAGCTGKIVGDRCDVCGAPAAQGPGVGALSTQSVETPDEPNFSSRLEAALTGKAKPAKPESPELTAFNAQPVNPPPPNIQSVPSTPSRPSAHQRPQP